MAQPDCGRVVAFRHYESKPGHKGIGHSRYCRGGKIGLFLQSLCHLGSLVDFARLVMPRSILFKMPLHIGDQIPPAFAPVVARDLVMLVAETMLEGVGG